MFRVTLHIAQWVFAVLLIVPVVIGLAGVVLPAFSYFPAIGETQLSFQAFKSLAGVDNLYKMVALSLFTGLGATFFALIATLAILAVCYQSRFLNWVQRLLSPVLVIPHAAAAIAVGFILSPGGWPVRLVSPWLTDWTVPPRFSLVHDGWGVAIIGALVLKALPFILLMALSVLSQPHVAARLNKQLNVARTMGYQPARAFLHVAWPVIYPAIRLPVLAVVAFTTANVEIPLILGPGSPPTLAVAILQWFNHIDISMRLQASAAACLQILVTCVAVLIWLVAERLAARVRARWQYNKKRNITTGLLKAVAGLSLAVMIVLVVVTMLSLILWSFATHWPFPDSLPQGVTRLHWASGLSAMQQPLLNTLLLAVPVSVVAIGLSLLVLEQEQLSAKTGWLQAIFGKDRLLFVPLLVPGVAFLFGLTWFSQLISAGQWVPVYLSHFIYVLPYVFLSLAVAYRRFDVRYAYVAYGLGASESAVFWRIKIPLLFAPIMVACALGVAISFSQYLATLLPGAGTIATLTTESVAVSAGGSRRLSAVYTLMQMVLPLVGFILAWWLPTRLFNPAVKEGRI